MDWKGDSPYILVVVRHMKRRKAPEVRIIDLDEPGWMVKNRALLAYAPATWHLARKSEPPRIDVRISMSVLPLEKPRFLIRHVGRANAHSNREVKAYGLVKLRRDGHSDKLWVLPNGQVCGGDDVDQFAMSILRGSI